jgi:EmrB/QacA subfamily drug resistance transporter
MIMVAMCTALVAVIASVSGLNVAQQQLAADLGASQSQLLWVINGYTIALAALLMPIGAIGDRFGRKPVLLSGLTVFAVANILAALATSPAQLIAYRVLAGVGAAMIMPVTLSVLTSSFPAEERGRAVGIWSGFAGGGGVLGLLSSAILVDNFTWPWLFVAPVILALAASAMTVAYVPHSKEHAEGRFDIVGSVLSALAVGGLVLGIHEGPEVGWTSGLAVLGLAVGVVATVGFVMWELRQQFPLLDLRVFKDRTLGAGSFGLTMTFAILMGLFLVLVQFLQAVLGFSAVRAALGLMPLIFMMMPLSALATGWAERVGLRVMMTTGTLLVAGGMAELALFASVDGGYWPVFPGILMLGAGMGLSMSPGTTAITGSLPEEKQGVASALNDTVREFGGAIGIAFTGSLLSAGYASSVTSATNGLPAEAAATVKEGIGGAFAVAPTLGEQGATVLAAARDAFIDGWQVAMWVGFGLAIATAAAIVIWIPRHQRVTDDVMTTEALDGLDVGELALSAGD